MVSRRRGWAVDGGERAIARKISVWSSGGRVVKEAGILSEYRKQLKTFGMEMRLGLYK